jgi:hypothetical protein
MATSPNYAWAEPDNSSLVKNGAQDIRALGDAIDTSVWNVGYGQTGKNKIINGDFSVNQRSFTTDSVGTFGFDRWLWAASGATGTYSAQTFTLGAAPVAGYESTNFARLAVTVGNDFCRMTTRMESVRTFAGQTATVSFWAKGTNPTTAGKLNVRLQQYFGLTGSPSSPVATAEQDLTLTASWARYSYTFAVPSISGKTITTADYLALDIGQLANASNQSWTLDLWGVQMEYGSYATPFQTASGGSPQAELAMCQRYYYRATLDAIGARLGAGYVNATTELNLTVPFPVTMRTKPTALEQNGTAADYQVLTTGNTITNCNAVPAISTATQAMQGVVQLPVASGLVAGQGGTMRVATAGAYLGWSAEL